LREAGIPVRVFPGGFGEWSKIVESGGANRGRARGRSVAEAENPGLPDKAAQSVVLLDLREAYDFKLDHIPGSVNFPAYSETRRSRSRRGKMAQAKTARRRWSSMLRPWMHT